MNLNNWFSKDSERKFAMFFKTNFAGNSCDDVCFKAVLILVRIVVLFILYKCLNYKNY
jgi:hypothetical protein